MKKGLVIGVIVVIVITAILLFLLLPKNNKQGVQSISKKPSENLTITPEIKSCMDNLQESTNYYYYPGSVVVLFGNTTSEEDAKKLIESYNFSWGNHIYSVNHGVNLQVSPGSELEWVCRFRINNEVYATLNKKL